MDYDVKNYIKTDEQTDARIKEGIEKNRKSKAEKSQVPFRRESFYAG